MSAFTTEDLYINSSTLRSMFNSCNHVEPQPYPGKDVQTGYYVLASSSQYKNGEKVVSNDMPKSLLNWENLFTSDVMYKMKLEGDTKPKIPETTTRPLSQTFYGEEQDLCEVTVIPAVKRDLKKKMIKDMCLVDILTPDLPDSTESAIKCNTYAGDIARNIMARYMLQMAPPDMDVGSADRIHPASAWINKRISYMFDTDLKEAKCGDKIIPAVMKNLWFLCDAVVNGTKCKIIQFSRFSYAAVLYNVAGFMVFIQVNCRIALDELKGILDADSPVPWQSRCHNTVVPNKLSGRCETKTSVQYKHVMLIKEKSNDGSKVQLIPGHLYMAVINTFNMNKNKSKEMDRVENDILQVIWNETQNVLRIKREFYLMEKYKQAQNAIHYLSMKPDTSKMTLFDKTNLVVSGLVLYGLVIEDVANRLGKSNFSTAVLNASKKSPSQAVLITDFVKFNHALDQIGKNITARRHVLHDVVPNIYADEESLLHEVLHNWSARSKILEEYTGDLKNIVKSVQANFFYTSPMLDKSLGLLSRSTETVRKLIVNYLSRNAMANKLEEELWQEQLMQNTFSSTDITTNIISIASQ